MTVFSRAEPTDLTSPHRHLAFGLCLGVPFPIAQLPSAPPDTLIDIHVSLGQTPQTLAQPIYMGRNDVIAADIQISNQGEMLWTTERARFWASGGSHIVVQPLVDTPPTTFRRFVLYNCLPCVLNQRGLLALHANAVVGAQGAIVLTGRSGAGKSTLFAALMTRGLAMLADDVTALQMDGERAPLALPGYPSYRLCGDALTQLTPVADRVVSLGGERNKYMLIAPKANRQTFSVPLHAIYILTPHHEDRLEIERALGIQAFRLLQENCYNPTAKLLLPHCFALLNQVVQNCAVYLVKRPTNRWTIDELVDHVLARQTAGANEE